jgi:molybdopterin biosynthesis enzyme
MPLYPNADALIRANLEAFQRGERVKPVAIGTLTEQQLAVLNVYRTEELGLPPNVAEVIFIGKHVYDRRVVDDGYTIEDAVEQVMSAMDAQSIVVTGIKLTTMQNLTSQG